MHYLSVITITLLVVTSELASGFHNFDINHLLLKVDQGQFVLSNVQEKWIDQPLDHFNASERRTLRMRYAKNLDWWRPNGPIYVFLNGEGEMNSNWIVTYSGNLMDQLAKETNGAMFITEHRYYGKSCPDISRDNLFQYYKFLNSEQALEDLASFIKFLKSDPKYKQSKVVVVGGSYSGNLATWLREYHPDLVDAAVASSAPVLAKKDFHEYYDVVRNTLDKYGTKNCLKNIDNKFNQYAQLLQSTSGIQTLKRELNICQWNDLSILENRQYLFFMLYILLSTQSSVSPEDVQRICLPYQSDIDLKLDHDKLNTTSEFGSTADCLNVDFSKAMYVGPWMYQMCNEFGYLTTTSSEKQPFVRWNPLQFMLKFCKYLVDGDIEKRVDSGVAWTNKGYGGRTPKVSKVVFTHGDMDPWSALGVLQDLGPDAPVTIVKGTSHCTILAVCKNEPAELQQSREFVKQHIKKWIL